MACKGVLLGMVWQKFVNNSDIILTVYHDYSVLKSSGREGHISDYKAIIYKLN